MANLPYPSNYLSYYWEDATERDSYSYVIRRLSQSKQSILNQQAKRAKKSIFKQYEKTGLFTNQDLAMLDLALSQSNLVDMSQVSEGFRPEVLTTSTSTEGLLSAVLQYRQALRDGADYQIALQDLVNAFNATSGLVTEVETYILTNFSTAKTVNSEAVQQMVKVLLSSPRGTLRKIPQNVSGTFSEVSRNTQSLLLKLYALGSNMIDTSSREAIEASIKSLSLGRWNDIQGSLGEASRRLVDSQSIELGLTSIVNTNQILQTRISGRKNVTVRMRTDPLLRQMLEKTQQENEKMRDSFTFSEGGIVSYADVQQKSDKEIVTNTGVVVGGINTKTSRIQIKDNIPKIPELKLQDSTPLLTFLGRELGLQGKTIQKIMQIGVAHGNDDYLDTLWDVNLRNLVTYGALSNILLGYGGQATSVIMQINNDFVPMADFIDFVVDGLTEGQISSISSMYTKNFPERANFVGINDWLSPKRKNYDSAIRRSVGVYAETLMMLSQAKITIRLNQINLMALSNYFI